MCQNRQYVGWGSPDDADQQCQNAIWQALEGRLFHEIIRRAYSFLTHTQGDYCDQRKRWGLQPECPKDREKVLQFAILCGLQYDCKPIFPLIYDEKTIGEFKQFLGRKVSPNNDPVLINNLLLTIQDRCKALADFIKENPIKLPWHNDD